MLFKSVIMLQDHKFLLHYAFLSSKELNTLLLVLSSFTNSIRLMDLMLIPCMPIPSAATVSKQWQYGSGNHYGANHKIVGSTKFLLQLDTKYAIEICRIKTLLPVDSLSKLKLYKKSRN